MELKQFIKTVLVEIIQAMDESRNSLGSEQAKSICPIQDPNYSIKGNMNYDSHLGLYLQQIEFDVAVSAETKDDLGAKAGINVLGIKASVGGNTNETNSSISRIKFHVPIGLSSKHDKS